LGIDRPLEDDLFVVDGAAVLFFFELSFEGFVFLHFGIATVVRGLKGRAVWML